MTRSGPQFTQPSVPSPEGAEDRELVTSVQATRAVATPRERPQPPPPPPRRGTAERRRAESAALWALDIEPPEETWVGFDSEWEDTPSLPQASRRSASVPPTFPPSSAPQAASPSSSKHTLAERRRRLSTALPAPIVSTLPPESTQARLALAPLRESPASPASPARRRSRVWMAGIALALGAGGLVASGYLAARVQLGVGAGAERTPVLVSAAPANVAVETSRGAVMAAPVETSAHGEAAPAQAAPVQLPHEAQPARSAPQRGSSRAEVRRERQHRKPKAVAVVPEVPAAANAPEPSDVETLAPPEPEPNSAAQEQAASEPPARVEAPAAEAANSPPVLTIKPLPADSAPSALGVSQQLTREQVRDAMLAAREQLAQCVGDKHGTSYASVTIEGSGRVSYSLIEGAFAGTSTGSCMARVLRDVTFPSFSGSAFKVRYPLVF